MIRGPVDPLGPIRRIPSVPPCAEVGCAGLAGDALLAMMNDQREYIPGAHGGILAAAASRGPINKNGRQHYAVCFLKVMLGGFQMAFYHVAYVLWTEMRRIGNRVLPLSTPRPWRPAAAGGPAMAVGRSAVARARRFAAGCGRRAARRVRRSDDRAGARGGGRWRWGHADTTGFRR